jgi:hypothetical protein
LHFHIGAFNLRVYFRKPIMPDEKRTDPFKPKQPAIPGTSPDASIPAPDAVPQDQYIPAPLQKSPLPLNYFVLAGVAAILVIAGLIYWSRSSSAKTIPPVAEAPEVAPAAPAEPVQPAPSLPLGPGVIGATADLPKPWSAKKFLFRGVGSAQPEPAMVVRLPHGDYWGFSLREPFGTCELEYVTDLDKLRTDYNFSANHPMVGNPCSRTVYDLLRYSGGASNDDLVRGLIVQGNGVRPPMAIEIRVDGKQIVAVRGE